MRLNDRRRVALAFALLFVLYQAAELIGDRFGHRFALPLLCMAAVVVVAWPLARWLGFRGYDAYALEWRKPTALLLAAGLVLALLMKYVAVCVGMALNMYAARAPESTQVAAVSFLSSMPWALVVTFLPSLAEDILTRGFPYRAARIAWHPVTFVLVSSLIYLLTHASRLGEGPAEGAMLLCYGLAYATAVVRTGSLWLAVGLHWGWSLANSLIGDILPYDVLSPWSPLLSAGAHLVMIGVLFGIPTTLERDDANADPA